MQKNLLILILSANLCVLLNSCADDQAREQLASNDARLSQLETTVGVLNNKVANQKLLDIVNKLDALQDQISQINGTIATLQADQLTLKDTIAQNNKAINDDNEDKLKNGDDHTNVVSDLNVKDTESEQYIDKENDALKLAVKNIKAHEFVVAIKDLKTIIKTTKNDNIKIQANYYLIVAYAASAQYKTTIFASNQFIKEYPHDIHVADVMFTMYISQKQLGMNESAKKTADTIRKKFPNSPVVKRL